jgi:putative Mn2+ efflux pump MntP
VVVLSAIGLACVALIVVGEWMGSPDRRIFWNLAGTALGGILIVYGVILLLLRKMGLIGPRRAER